MRPKETKTKKKKKKELRPAGTIKLRRGSDVTVPVSVLACPGPVTGGCGLAQGHQRSRANNEPTAEIVANSFAGVFGTWALSRDSTHKNDYNALLMMMKRT